MIVGADGAGAGAGCAEATTGMEIREAPKRIDAVAFCFSVCKSNS